MKLFEASVIPHKKQMYPTVGDWKINKRGEVVIKVSFMRDERFSLLVAIHELLEAVLCHHRGIEESDVTKFDVEYEKKRKKGDFSEPGNSKKAPYCTEHQFATKVEKMVAKELGVDWNEYDEMVNKL